MSDSVIFQHLKSCTQEHKNIFKWLLCLSIWYKRSLPRIKALSKCFIFSRTDSFDIRTFVPYATVNFVPPATLLFISIKKICEGIIKFWFFTFNTCSFVYDTVRKKGFCTHWRSRDFRVKWPTPKVVSDWCPIRDGYR